MKLPARVTITEVGPRDGLQNENKWIETSDKIRLIDALADTGLTAIEATSFVHPRAIPQMRDSAEVMAGIRRRPSMTYVALVPNPVGARNAIAAGADELAVFVSASESHNRANVKMAIADSLRGFEEVVRIAEEAGRPVRGYVSTAFGCPYEGDVPPAQVTRIAAQLRDLGMHEVSLGDTTGMGNPRQVGELMAEIQVKVPGVTFGLHSHDTRGTGLANNLAALQVGITQFEGSVGGLGGCPYAPGAAGNIATEDFVYLLHEMDVETGIDLENLIACARLAQELAGRELPGKVLKAGPRLATVRAAV
jgi:hydroxymethylglutaryl-CoA lyase